MVDTAPYQGSKAGPKKGFMIYVDEPTLERLKTAGSMMRSSASEIVTRLIWEDIHLPTDPAKQTEEIVE